MSSLTLEETLDRQCEKLRDLETVTVFIKGKHAMKEEFLEMHIKVSCMCEGIDTMKMRLQYMKEQNDRCTELLSLLRSLEERIVHIEKNIPSKMIDDYANSTHTLRNSPEIEQMKKLQTRKTEEHETPMKDCKKTLFNEPEVYPVIPLLTENEFSTIPKYIIGRQSLETVNDLINTINQILKAKYTLLSLGKVQARKQGNLNLYLDYKRQDMDICNNRENIYSFTAVDYEKQTNSKLNKIKLNLLTVLRHCKRLREHRVKNDLRYVILTK